MNLRHFSLLDELIEHYISTGQPISSGYLAGVHNPCVSPATVRNIMAELEEEGYLEKPHTSAGRIPSEKGYQAYVKSLGMTSLSPKLAQEIAHRIPSMNRENLKAVAQYIAENTGEMIYIAFGRNDTYYTGLSHLVSKPEFCKQELLADITGLIDHLDRVLEEVLNDEKDDVSVYIGSQSCFGPACSTLVMRYTLNDMVCLLGILGPMRMNYSLNKAFLEETRSIINT
ncbi:MAG: hypothetical protein Q8P11_01295 [bacterium]|nr:hypothetical protein [bacterium]